MIKKVFIFRHGETDWNAEGRFQGHIDVPLNEKGRQQARDLIEVLREKGLEAILSSDLSRARETGEIVASALGISLSTNVGIREAFLGQAQGLTFDEIKAKFGIDVTSRWGSSHATDADVSYPGGETGVEVVTRVFAAIESFLRTNDFTVVGIASHGGVIRRVLHTILPPGSPAVRIPNTVVYELSFNAETGEWKQHSLK